MAVERILAELKALGARQLAEATAPPKGMYTSPDILALEQERIFGAGWLCAGRADEIARPGDYMTFEMGPQPVILVRGKDGAVRAHANTCRHRMMRLVEGKGNASRFTCPYHAWTYGLDGGLVAAPHMDRTSCFDKKELSLADIRCEIYRGWIYVTLNGGARPVADMLAPLTSVIERYGQEHYRTIFTEEHVWDTNWKCLTENFMESYHLPVAHRETVGANFTVSENTFGEAGDADAFAFQFFTKTEGAPVGRAHPANDRLEGDWRRTSVMPTVFPSHMYVLAPDHLWYLSLQPDGVGRTRIRYGAALAPEVMDSADDSLALIAEKKAFLDKVQVEDKHVVEGIFNGAMSPLAVPGPLSWMEQENHQFARYLARHLCD